MAKEISKPASSLFEQIKKVDDKGNEFWTSRDMAKVLEYSEYRHFLPVVDKAKEASKNSGHKPEDHFEDILEMVGIGSGAERAIENIKLSRYACYLIVQNADPSKEVVALGQTYFAVQTRLREIQQMDEYNRLRTENEKRIFLRNEMAKHNTLHPKIWRRFQVDDSLSFYDLHLGNKKKISSIISRRGRCAELFVSSPKREMILDRNPIPKFRGSCPIKT